MKPQEEAIEIATKHQLRDSISSRFYTHGSKSYDGVGAAYEITPFSKQKQLQFYNAYYLLNPMIATLQPSFQIRSPCFMKSLTAFSKDPLITDIQNIYTELISSRSIKFYWCPGDAIIFGNECADRFAKLAVNHRREPTSSIKITH